MIHYTARLVWKILIFLLGAIVIALGLVMLPLPGPGFPIIVVGVAILALEFAWAKIWMRIIKKEFNDATTKVGQGNFSGVGRRLWRRVFGRRKGATASGVPADPNSDRKSG